jgi:hypothetical protein
MGDRRGEVQDAADKQRVTWPLVPPLAMESINRFLYGPTPQERVRTWQQKLRQEQRVLDREVRQVRRREPQSLQRRSAVRPARSRPSKSTAAAQAVS